LKPRALASLRDLALRRYDSAVEIRVRLARTAKALEDDVDQAVWDALGRGEDIFPRRRSAMDAAHAADLEIALRDCDAYDLDPEEAERRVSAIYDAAVDVLETLQAYGAAGGDPERLADLVDRSGEDEGVALVKAERRVKQRIFDCAVAMREQLEQALKGSAEARDEAAGDISELVFGDENSELARESA
jgi:hypothetical protein